MPANVLVIEDDPDTRANLTDILDLDGYSVQTAATVGEALAVRDWSVFWAIILDRKLPDGGAEQLLPALRRLAPHAGIVVVTGYADVEGAIAALRQGAVDYILKPINPEVLRARLRQLEERSRLSAATRRSEAAFRTLVETAPCMIVILRPDHSIHYMSHFAEQLTGYSSVEVEGRNFIELFVPAEAQRAVGTFLDQSFSQGPTRGLENPVLCRDGSRRWMVWNAERLADYEGGPAILKVGQDITNVKDAQEKALRSERLAAIGQMMTGLAHESGNALARSQACLEMLSFEVEDRPEALDLIGRIQKAQDHLRQLYEEVRNYASPIRLDREDWDVAGIWRQAWHNLSMLRQGRNALLRESIAANTACVVDHFRLEQVFRNIFENSLAVCRDPVVIEVRCSEIPSPPPLSPGGRGEGGRGDSRRMLEIAVRDNGPGLDAVQRQRIFEPFFTTKTKGTGLGMAIALRLIEAHGGNMAVGSNSAPGAEILIRLPREPR